MDQLISEMIKGLVEAVTLPSLVNLDFADLRTIMRHKGVSTILYGESTDPDGAVREALSNPLLEIDYEGATGALIHVTGGDRLSVKKATRVLTGMSEQLDLQAQVIFGARVDPECKDIIRVMAVITGIKELPQRANGRSHEREELDDALEELVSQCGRR
jgi:cell division protein FtsZ